MRVKTMRIKLTVITPSVTIAISLAGIIASGWFFQNRLATFKTDEKVSFSTEIADRVSNAFDKTIEEISTGVQNFSYSPALTAAMQSDDTVEMTRLLTDLNVTRLPFKADMLYINHANHTPWTDARDFFSLPDYNKITLMIEKLPAHLLYTNLTVERDGKEPQNLLVFSSPIHWSHEPDATPALLRVVYNMDTESQFIAQLLERVALDCIGIYMQDQKDEFAKCVHTSRLVKTSTLDDDAYMAVTTNLSKLPVLSNLKAMIYRDISLANSRWKTVNRNIMSTLFFLLLLAVVFSFIFMRAIKAAVVRLVRYVSLDHDEFIAPPHNTIAEFHDIAVAYHDARQKLHEQTEKKKRAEARAMTLVTELDESQSQKMEALGTLTASVAHDFNNLLAIIRTQAESTCLSEKVSRDAKMLSGVILETVDRASGLVSQLLCYAGPARKEERVFRLDKALAQLVKELKTDGTTKIETAFLNPDNLAPMVEVDPSQFKAMLLNLWVNACHAMSDGGTFTITLRPAQADFGDTEVAPDQYVQIDITDTGHGIDEKSLKKIFDPFFTTKSLSGGTGLGLSIIYSFIKESNGRIDVKSVVGEGTTFSIELPVTKNTAVRPHTKKKKKKDKINLNGLRVFVLEDEPALSTAMARMISVAGGESDQVNSLEHALKLLHSFSEFPYDVLVTDYQLLDGTGLEFHAALQEKFGEVPTVIVSGNLDYADRDFKQNAPDSVQFLPKPYTFSDFLQCLETASKSRKRTMALSD